MTLNFLNGSVLVLGLNKDNGFVLLGELSCRLAFLCSGVEQRRFGYKSIAEAAQSPETYFCCVILQNNLISHIWKENREK